MPVRVLHQNDADAAAALLQAAGWRGWDAKTLRDSRDDRVVVAAGPVGAPFAVAIAQYVLDEGELLAVAVAPMHRRQGYGDRLVQAAIDFMKKREVRRLFLEVRQSNVAAQRLYAQRGFEATGHRRDFYGDEDAVIMTLALLR
ncbi:MAG: ribosomal protein S18-alanine N-acetyltransferase [Myxococcota bacterium]